MKMITLMAYLELYFKEQKLNILIIFFFWIENTEYLLEIRDHEAFNDDGQNYFKFLLHL